MGRMPGKDYDRKVGEKYKPEYKLQAVIEKTKGRCWYCGRIRDRMVFDHVIPRVHGGLDTYSNLARSCSDCNARKYTKSLEEFRLLEFGSDPQNLFWGERQE